MIWKFEGKQRKHLGLSVSSSYQYVFLKKHNECAEHAKYENYPQTPAAVVKS